MSRSYISSLLAAYMAVAGQLLPVKYARFQVLAAACMRMRVNDSSPLTWRHYAPLKSRSASIRLHGAVSRKAVCHLPTR
jgi:hypothetical protein